MSVKILSNLRLNQRHMRGISRAYITIGVTIGTICGISMKVVSQDWLSRQVVNVGFQDVL